MEDDGFPGSYSQRLIEEAGMAASAIRSADSVRVVTHIDADGITAGSIAAITLQRLGKKYVLDFEKKISDETIVSINSSTEDIVWICDLGSAYMSKFVRNGIIVTDHHVPDPKWRAGQSVLEAYGGSFQMNPHLYGRSGSFEVCGAGMTYLLSKAIDPRNVDLAYLAVIGAVGDFQDTRESRLVSYNRLILQDAVGNGDVSVSTDIRYFGRGTRPILQFLQYGEEPRIDGITDDRDGCLALLNKYGVDTIDGNGTRRTWSDLDPSEKVVLTDDMLGRVSSDPDRKALRGEVYSINRFEPHSGLWDAKEFATVLNSCGRYDDASTGARLCMGDISALNDAEQNRIDHRKNISAALTMVKENHLLRKRKYVQYFDAGSSIRETVIGIVAGMVLNSGDADRELPIIAFASADDGIKVSARAPRELVRNGLDLSTVMKDAAESVGGLGGGHNIAAGATIPEGKEEVFLDKVEEIIASQISL